MKTETQPKDEQEKDLNQSFKLGLGFKMLVFQGCIGNCSDPTFQVYVYIYMYIFIFVCKVRLEDPYKPPGKSFKCHCYWEGNIPTRLCKLVHAAPGLMSATCRRHFAGPGVFRRDFFCWLGHLAKGNT